MFHQHGGKQLPLPPGSALGVICPNVPNEVDKMLKLLNLSGNECIDITASATDAQTKARFERSYAYLPSHCRIRHLFEYVVDLRTVLKKAFLKLLGDYCPEGSSDRQVLHELSSINQEGYRTEVLEDRMMIFDLLTKFPTCQPTLAVLIEHLARLTPRFYTVANYSEREIKFIYRPMEFKSLGRLLRGQCSTLFDRLQQVTSSDLETQLNNINLESIDTKTNNDSTVTCYIRKNVRNFTFPISPAVPFIFVCHGTGIAPFLAYLHLLEANPDMMPIESWLFYGCRYAHRDALFDVEAVRKSGFRCQLRQSRVDPITDDVGKIQRGYVQDGLLQYAGDVRKLLVDDVGELLICGDFQTMAKDTLSVLEKILTKQTLENLLKENRIKFDVWT